MHSSIVGKIEKAHRYAQERERIRFVEFKVTFRGDNDTHDVALAGGRWHCTCDFFATHVFCAHTMALEKILGGMVPEGAQSASDQG
jgi:hypothetical protein